jgi:RND family efflux transporter MFP subunit
MTFLRRQPRWRLGLVAVVIVAAGLLWFATGGKTSGNVPTFAARRGPLEITVLEGGSLQALESQEIKCEVRVGYQGAKILKIVEEGYFVTEDDVKTNKVLCELDSSELQSKLVQQEIQYQSALASLTDAQQNYEIQLGQNQSDVKAAEQKARFARIDFDKLLGDQVAAQIISETGLNDFLDAVRTNNVEQTLRAEEVSNEKALAEHNGKPPAIPVGTGQVATANPANPAAPPPADTPLPNGPFASPTQTTLEMPKVVVDFSKYASIDALGDGEAKQKLRKLDDDLQVAQKELGQATTALEGTRRLFEKGFVPKTEIIRDEISYESAVLKVKSAETSRALYLKYEFPKSAEEALSKYTEAVRELDKARRVAISRLAQARAKLNSAKGQYAVQSRQLADVQDQLDKCTLRAKKSGLVVYGGGRDNYYNQEPIREGASVRERQTIITIPDMKQMSVNVKIHESYIKKIKKGQKARVTADAFPDQPLTGEVTKVAVLPDSQDRWMNPDLKVYQTTVTIDGTNEWAKPGMSAKVEILVNHLKDVVYVPVQAVTPVDNRQYCYVKNGFGADRREVQIGEFNDEFIEVKNGLKEGELVLLRPPSAMQKEGAPPERKPEESEPKEPPAVAAEPAKNGKS